MDIGATDFDPENIPSIGTLLHCCQGLIMVDKEASIVRLIHHTVQEYLCSHPGLFNKPYSILAEACLTYLSSQQVKNLGSHSLPDHQRMPFLKYSSRYWGTHAGRELSNYARTLALELLGQYEDHVAAVSLVKQVLQPSYTGGIGTPPYFSGLHCASFFGIVGFVTAIINADGCEINQQDCTGNTPLGWATINGYEAVVKLQVEQGGVDPNCPDEDGITPLGLAALSGHERLAKLLLEREDVDLNRLDTGDRTLLGWAALSGHEGVVMLLVDRDDVDLNRPDVNDRTPLGSAAAKGHESVVKLLLEQEGVGPNRLDKYGGTPLSYAT